MKNKIYCKIFTEKFGIRNLQRKMEERTKTRMEHAFKESIRQRDNHTCQLCGIVWTEKHSIPLHHIDFNSRNNDPQNLIALCNHCHPKVHGKKNERYFRELLLKHLESA